MMSSDQARAQRVMSLMIRRHRDAKEAFRAMLRATLVVGRTRNHP
jgi:hypothetical protein